MLYHVLNSFSRRLCAAHSTRERSRVWREDYMLCFSPDGSRFGGDQRLPCTMNQCDCQHVMLFLLCSHTMFLLQILLFCVDASSCLRAGFVPNMHCVSLEMFLNFRRMFFTIQWDLKKIPLVLVQTGHYLLHGFDIFKTLYLCFSERCLSNKN